jgi:hypothetical protein
VAAAVKKINEKLHPKVIILVGHSRGGLAARAYLQEITEPPPFKLGLLTIGTPHQGTSLGRVKHWLLGHGFLPQHIDDAFVSKVCVLLHPDICLDALAMIKSLLFSPSVGYQATAHDVNGNPIRKPISEAIWGLNDGADRLEDWVSTFGQIYSTRMRLGKNSGNAGVNLLNSFIAQDASRVLILKLLIDPVIPGGFREMRRFVLRNIGHFDVFGKWRCGEQRSTDPFDWACNGDGIVPAISQRLTHLPGFSRGGKPLHSIQLREILHADASGANDGETGQVLEIGRILDEIKNDLQ